MVERIARYEALSGLVFVVLIVANIFAGGANSPNSDASAGKVVSYYQSHVNGTRASSYIIGLAIIVGLYFFFGVLRSYLRQDADSERFVSIAMAGVVLFASAGAVNAGLNWALVDQPTRLSPATMQVLNVLHNDLATFFQAAGGGALLLAAAVVILRSSLLPAWFGWVSVVLGVAAVAGAAVQLGLIAVGLWLLVLSPLLYRRLGSTEIRASHRTPGPLASDPA